VCIEIARHSKTILTSKGYDRRESGYYSTPDFIARFITEEMLRLNPTGKKVFDPCQGKEELLRYFADAGKKVYGIDIFDFGCHNIASFEQKDFLEYYASVKDGSLFNFNNINSSLDYDYYIANPPYNCHEVDYIQKNKHALKTLFGEIGVHNMYSMFISAMIDMASVGALLGILTLDSFLTSKAHAPLRRQILKETSIHHILLCPIDLFRQQQADVRTCIIILQKGKQYQKSVKTGNRVHNIEAFKKFLSTRDFSQNRLDEITLNGKSDFSEFLIGVPNDIRQLLKLKYPRLGELFNCITGISTGNDGKYLVKKSKKGFTVPFYKNPGSRKFYTAPDGYLPDDFLAISENDKNFLVRNKAFLYKPGITCSSMGIPFSACYLPGLVTYGVNANIICDVKDIGWLLGYLNSRLVTYLVRGILIRTNMITSGYVSRIPLIEFSSSEKASLAKIAYQAYQSVKQNRRTILEPIIEALDKIVFEASGISCETQVFIRRFSLDLIINT
jgi:hypothetical protein